MSSSGQILEDLLEECGGFGRFQTMLLVTVLLSKMCTAWSQFMMTFAGAYPDWWCDWNTTDAMTSLTDQNNSLYKTCDIAVNNTNVTNECSRYIFDETMTTAISEWDLVCDKEWVSSTITTIQMAGLFVSGFIGGYLGDAVGRKPTFFLTLFFLSVFNVLATLSTSWEMFAVFRFFIGFFIGCYFIVYVTFAVEFIPAKWRPLVLALPAWSLWVALFGPVAWWLHDWKYLHYASAAIGVPWLLLWWVYPESFRWLVANNKIDEAEKVIIKIAKFNKRPLPNFTKIKEQLMICKKTENISSTKSYTVKDLFHNWHLGKTTILISICWMSGGYGYYAISFGVQKLSGDLYLNMTLLSLVEIPTLCTIIYLVNWIGRRWTAILFLLISAIGSLIVATVEIIEIADKENLINGFALTAKLGVTTGWATVQILTTESYPTVVRNIGYGFHNAIARIGAMVAPQVVFLGETVEGVMYYLCGGLMLLSAICVFFVQETNKRALQDTLMTIESKNESTKIPQQKYGATSTSEQIGKHDDTLVHNQLFDSTSKSKLIDDIKY